MPDNDSNKISIGSGITEIKYIVDEKNQKYYFEEKNENNKFPKIFSPDRLPSNCAIMNRIYHPKELEKFLSGILESCGLPHNMRSVLWLGKEKWREIPSEIRATFECAHSNDTSVDERNKCWNEWCLWWEAYSAENTDSLHSICNVSQATQEDEYLLSDSAGGYAARLLAMLQSLGSLDDTYWKALDNPETDVFRIYQKGIEFGLLYSEANLKFNWERDAQIGKKVSSGGKKGHAKAYGTNTERNVRYAEYQSALDEIVASSPEIGITEARSKVASKFGVSVKTIQRYTSPPK